MCIRFLNKKPKLQDKSVNVTTNGQTSINADSNYDGLDTVTVNTNVQPTLQSKTVTITENGTTNITPDIGNDGLSSVSVTTNVSGGGDEWYINDASYLFIRGIRLDIMDNLIPKLKNIVSCYYMFGSDNSNIRVYTLRAVPLFDTSNVTNMDSMFQYCSNLTTVPLFNTSSVTSMSNMFNGCQSLTSIPQLDTSSVTAMNQMFVGCRSLTSIPQLDTSSVTAMGYMFTYCSNLTTIPLLNTSKVTSMVNMFQYCSALTNDSLNNILAMCSNATSYTGTKTLKQIGLSSTQATTCQSLSNYQAFLDAGWTTGY